MVDSVRHADRKPLLAERLWPPEGWAESSARARFWGVNSVSRAYTTVRVQLIDVEIVSERNS